MIVTTWNCKIPVRNPNLEKIGRKMIEEALGTKINWEKATVGEAIKPSS